MQEKYEVFLNIDVGFHLVDIGSDRRNNIGLTSGRGLHQVAYPTMHEIRGCEQPKNGDQPESGQDEEYPFDAGRHRFECNRLE